MHPTWHRVTDPPTGWKTSKAAWATVDSFSAGLEATFSEVPAGTKAVWCYLRMTTFANDVYYRASGDTNVSNTPHASSEYAWRIMSPNDQIYNGLLWVNSDLKIQLTVVNNTQDIYVAYPVGYLL